MDRVAFLVEKGNLQRQLKDGRIDRATFNRRFSDLLHRAAGVSDTPSFDEHVRTALEVVK